MADTYIKISELEETTLADDASYIPIDNGNHTYKISVENYNSGANATAQSYAEAAAASADDAETAKTAAEAAETETGLIRTATQQYATAAAGSAADSAASAIEASTHAEGAATSESNAEAAAQDAADYATLASDKATLAESWAVGDTHTRTGEDTNNASYYAGQAQGAYENALEQADAAGDSADAAASSASDAADSATAAAGSAGDASDYATAASGSATAAATSATQSANSAGAAATSATNAAASATAASGSASTATTQANNAAQSATTAGGYATQAASSASDASGYATNAANSATAAAGSATTASNQATAAAGSATAAAASASDAADSAADAAESAATFTTDDTLSIAGKAADAKAAGDMIAAVQAEIPELDNWLTTPGAAAEAKHTGDRLTEVEDDVSDLKSALTKFYLEETETGKIFRFGESDGVLKVVSDSEVTVGNQNILDTPLLNYDEHTANGLTYQKQTDGSIRISGTATANANIWLNQTAKFPQGTYTLSGCPSGGSGSTYRMICNYRINGVDYTWLIDTGNGATAELTTDIDNVRCAITIFNGATVDLTFYPQLEYASTKSAYAMCANETVSANTDISIDGIKTIFASTAFNLTASQYGWTDDILNVQNEVNALSDSVDEAEETVALIDGLLTANIQHFNIDDYSLVCIHHDNFSRTMTGWEIGMNAGGDDTGNNYEWVTASTYDDGLRVDEGATFESNSSRTNPFSLRKIATDHADDFVIETNAPTANNQVGFAFNVQNIRNMTYVSARKQTNGYAFSIQDITNNSFGTTKYSAFVTNVLANVMRLCFHKQWLYVFLDDLLVASVFVGDVGNSLYLFSYKGITVHFDFVNIFNITNHKEWNPNHILDTGISEIPLVVTSANDGGYALQNVKTRWSDYADKFLLNSTDPLVHNGHRSERSVTNLSGYTGNLRHLKISFDVYFPSTSVDTERNDIMMQMHDRDGTYRGFVPYILNFDNNKIKITLASTHAPKDGADDVLKWVEGAEIASINADEWHRFELEIKERYDENQNPFVKISIDNKLVFESHKPNCFNDLLGSSPQYGIYKNLWGTGVTTFERYFDNFKIEY